MRRHPADLLSLVCGLAFVAAAALLLAGRFDLVTNGGWIVPLLMIVVALTILASVAWSARGSGRGGDAEL